MVLFFNFLLIVSAIFLFLHILLGINTFAQIAYLALISVLFSRLIDCFELQDYFNVFGLSLLIFFFLIILITADKLKNNKFRILSVQILISLLIYSVLLNFLQNYLIEAVGRHMVFLGNFFGFKILYSNGSISFKSCRFDLSFECTAAEALSIFPGIVLGVGNLSIRKLLFVLIAEMLIYLANLLRNLLICLICGLQLFGENSFLLAHNVFAKIYSLLVVIVMAFFTIKINPELLVFVISMKNDLYATLRELKRI